MTNIYLNIIKTGKKAYNLASNCEIERVRKNFVDILFTFPEIKEKGYIVITLGEYSKRMNMPNNHIQDLIKNNQYNKKAVFKLSCYQTGVNTFYDMPILSTPELLYIV